MSIQPSPGDFIEIRVEEDGDILLIKRCKPGEQNGPADMVFPPTGNLCYDIDELEALQAELASYGCSEGEIKRALLEVTFEEYNEEVKV